jgi:hypothetical protein
VHTHTASTTAKSAVELRKPKTRFVAPLALVVGLMAAPAFADTYTYSPERPYPPEDRAATEYMGKGYMTGAADTEGYYWARPDGSPDAPQDYDPWWVFAPLRSLAAGLGLAEPAGR